MADEVLLVDNEDEETTTFSDEDKRKGRIIGVNDVLYIRELGYNFENTENKVDLYPVILDATTSYSKKYNARVTKNPVGDKTDRADHYTVNPAIINFAGVISNTTLGIYGWAMGVRGTTGRAQQYIERLEKILSEKILIEVRAPDGLSTTNCLLTSLNIKRDTQTGDGFHITASATQVQFVTGVILSEPAKDIADTVESSSDDGSASSEDVSQGHSMEPIVGEVTGNADSSSSSLYNPNLSLGYRPY